VFYLLALCCAAIGVIAYGIGVAYAAFVHAGPDAAVCPVGRMQSPPVRESLVPLAHDCLYADGTTVHLVPGSVNPLAFATIIATGAFIVLGLHASRRRRSARASPAEDNAAARR
jgi:hypothetical protein